LYKIDACKKKIKCKKIIQSKICLSDDIIIFYDT